jgi:hypothetical protein
LGELVTIPRRRRKSEALFWRMLKIQVGLVVFQFLAGSAIGVTVKEHSLRSNLLMTVTAPFVLLNLWLLLQNWLIYIYDVGLWGDRIKAAVALVFTIATTIGGVTSVGDFREPAIQAEATLPLPLTDEQLSQDEQLLADEDAAEATYQQARSGHANGE